MIRGQLSPLFLARTIPSLLQDELWKFVSNDGDWTSMNIKNIKTIIDIGKNILYVKDTDSLGVFG